eukprot:3059491-Prymnesium_polylepis.2
MVQGVAHDDGMVAFSRPILSWARGSRADATCIGMAPMGSGRARRTAPQHGGGRRRGGSGKLGLPYSEWTPGQTQIAAE